MVFETQKFFGIRNKILGILFFASVFFLFSNSAQAAYTAQYWNGSVGASPTFPTGSPNVTTTTNDINFDWGESSPAPGTINVDGFLARWTETKTFNEGTYSFSATVDDGIKIYVDDLLILNSWKDQGSTFYSRNYDLSAGSHTIKVEYYENGGGAVCQFSYYNLSPSVSSFTPSDNATGISPTTNLVINFNQTVYTSPSVSNDIVIKKASDNSTVETIDAKDAKVSGHGTSSITINPSTTLLDNTAYYIQIGANAFYNGSSYYYPGINNTTTWNFTTGDFTNPSVSALSPADDAVGVGLTANLVMTFDESITAGTGYVTIYKSSDDSVFEQISVADSKITGSGTSTITINPAGIFTEKTDYYVKIDAAAFDDLSGNSYSGIDNSTAWNFTSADLTAPTISNIASIPSSTSAVISWNTNEAASSQVQYGLTSSFGSTTSEADTSPRLTSHSVNLSNLHACARYYYRVKSKDAGNNLAASATSSFVTSGCEKSTIDSGDEKPISSGGGNLSTDTDHGTAELIIPSSFFLSGGTPQGANFQINKLDEANVSGIPFGKDLYQDNFFDLLAAKDDGTPITSFDKDITFTVYYGSDTEAKFLENTLDVYKYSGGNWTKKNCTLDATANTLTCSLNSFSTYAILGDKYATEDNSDNDIEKAMIDSWKAEKYTNANKSCSERLKIIIKGKHFAKDATVEIGDKKAAGTDRRSSQEIVAKFCLNKLLSDETDHKRKIYLTNPGADTEEADEEIELDDISSGGIAPKDSGDGYYDQKTQNGARHIQETLNKLGYLDAENITSTYGSITTEAVKKFQSDNGIEPTGFVGELTKAALGKK